MSAEPTAESAAAYAQHARVLEAARLLDALHPALLDPDRSNDGSTGAQSVPPQRARAVDELVAKGARADVRKDSGGFASGAALERASPAVQRARERQSPLAARRQLVRKPWLSLLLFASMVGVSVVPLLRYAGSGEEGARAISATAPMRRASVTPGAHAGAPQDISKSQTRAPLSRGGADRARAITEALSEGARAVERDDLGAAERMFGQVLELAEDHPRAAFGLARVRLKQNNLSGAEGWIQLALRKRPRRAAYHALYAEVLTRMGRLDEASREQALVQALEDPRAAGGDGAQVPGAGQ